MTNCPVCGNNTSSKVLSSQSSGYGLIYCEECELRFSSPMKPAEADFYKNCSLYDERSQKRQLSKTSDWRFRGFIKECSDVKNKSLLDIGCGDGKFLEYAENNGFKVHGVDLDERGIEYAKNVRGLANLVCSHFEQIEGRDGWTNFGAITLLDVLEHLADPLRMLRFARKLLDDNGYIFITVPRFDRCPRVFDAESDFPPHHLTLWTPKALTKLLKKADFRDVRIIEAPLTVESFVYHLIWRIKRLKTGKTVNNDVNVNVESKSTSLVIIYLLKRAILSCFSVINYIIKILRIGRGHTLLAIGKK